MLKGEMNLIFRNILRLNPMFLNHETNRIPRQARCHSSYDSFEMLQKQLPPPIATATITTTTNFFQTKPNSKALLKTTTSQQKCIDYH